MTMLNEFFSFAVSILTHIRLPPPPSARFCWQFSLRVCVCVALISVGASLVRRILRTHKLSAWNVSSAYAKCFIFPSICKHMVRSICIFLLLLSAMFFLRQRCALLVISQLRQTVNIQSWRNGSQNVMDLCELSHLRFAYVKRLRAKLEGSSAKPISLDWMRTAIIQCE